MKRTTFFILLSGLLLSMGMLRKQAPQVQKRLLVDVSHGGSDYGAHAFGTSEKELVLAIAKQLELLAGEDDRIEVVLTREDDHHVSLKERVRLANTVSPDLAISIHARTDSLSELSGVEVFYNSQRADSANCKHIAQELLSSVSAAVGARYQTLTSSGFYFLKYVEAPSVLIELGYLSNPFDADYLHSEDGQIKIARAILDASLER